VDESRKRVIRLMQEDGLKARARKRYKVTTMSDHDQPVAANLLDRQFAAAAPNQRWVSDTTEFVIGSSGSGKLYLAAVLDLFSRFIVGWAVSAVNDRHVTIKALEMALKRRCPDIGLLHHSDQGCTYASEDYQDILESRGIVCSMSRRGNCWDNAVMESFFSTVKSELGERFDSHGEAKMALFHYIEVFYNQRRRHSTLGQISPATFERRKNKEGMEPMETRTERGFPQVPHPSSLSTATARPSSSRGNRLHVSGGGYAPDTLACTIDPGGACGPDPALGALRGGQFQGMGRPLRGVRTIFAHGRDRSGERHDPARLLHAGRAG
jgi:transposase InsO family protein